MGELKSETRHAEPKEGDIYRWSWNDKELGRRKDQSDSGTLYWCCSRICVFKDGWFVDTYWGESGSNRAFSVEKATELVVLEYIGNFDGLIETDKSHRAYYLDSDCVDISHPNKSRGGFYIRKGAEKSLDKMQRVMRRILSKHEKDMESAARRIEQTKAQIADMTAESYISTVDGVSLSDSSYEDYELRATTPSPLAGYRERIKLWVAEQLDYWQSHKDHPAAIIVLKDLLIAVNSGELEK